jgi:Flp pilus assembly protein TadD
MRRPARSALRRSDGTRSTAGTPQHPARPRPGAAATALAARPSPVQAAEIGALLQAAVGRHQVGQLREAEALYRQVLALDSEQPDALNLLGVLAYQAGQPAAAVPLIERAITHRPNAPSLHLNLAER